MKARHSGVSSKKGRGITLSVMAKNGINGGLLLYLLPRPPQNGNKIQVLCQGNSLGLRERERETIGVWLSDSHCIICTEATW